MYCETQGDNNGYLKLMTAVSPNVETNKIWAVGGGKGGVGKTVFTANLAVSLANRGNKVVVVDADLGGANIHTILGVKRIQHNLGDFLINKKYRNISDVVVNTPVKNLGLVSGANGILEVANPSFAQKMKVIAGLRKVEANIVLLDLGAGTTFNTLDFFNLADSKILVACPEPTSIQNVYGFIKSAIYRKILREFHNNTLVLNIMKQNSLSAHGAPLCNIGERFISIGDGIKERYDRIFSDFQPKIVMNMLRREEEKSMAHGIGLVSKKFLNVSLEYVGHLYMDNFVIDSVQEMVPFTILDTSHRVSQCIDNISDKLTK